MTQTAKLRASLNQPGMVIAPGAYDGLTAMLVAQAGFPAVYMTGAGTSVSHGYPDFGLLTATEMVANAARMVRAVDVPVIADADTGYGNELNVVRTVRDYEQAGVAGIHIEDQVSPKRCGHLDDKEIVPREDWIAKIRAARAARQDADFLIIARTDLRAVAGFEEAISRANEALGEWCRHGVRRGAADDGRNRRRAEAGQGPLPAERGVGRQDTATGSARGGGARLQTGDRAGTVAESGDRRLRRRAGGTEGNPQASDATRRDDGAGGVQPRRRRRVGSIPDRVPLIRVAGLRAKCASVRPDGVQHHGRGQPARRRHRRRCRA